MKILSNIIFIFVFIYIQTYETTNSDFLTYLEETRNDFYQIQYNQLSSGNINDSLKYLAPSYFALIIKEIVPKGSSLTDFISSSNCLKDYFIQQNQTKVIDLVKYSAKSFPDFGDEDGCISNHNNAFILFTIKYNNLDSSGYKGQFKLLPFISTGFSFYGLCVENTDVCTTELTDHIKYMINNNQGMLNGIENLTMYTFIHYPKNSEKNKSFSKTSFYVVYSVFGILIVGRLLVALIGSRFFQEKEDFSSDKNINEGDSSSDEEEEEDEETNTKTPVNLINDEKSNELIEKEKIQIPKRKLYPKWYFFVQLCSFKYSLKILYQKTDNIYYNEADLYFILLCRFIALIFKLLYVNFNMIIHNPSKEVNNTSIFKHSIIIFIKFSSFSDVIIIITESIFVSYKLMSFIRKYTKKTEQPSVKLFLNFFLRIIPSIFGIMIIFISFYIYNDALKTALHLNEKENDIHGTRIQHISDNLVNCQSCVNSWKNLIPFYMHYENYNEKNIFNQNCFQFMIIMVNLFYGYFFCILITYISFKIKNKIFDIVLSIIFVISFLLPNNLSCNSYLEDHKYFNVHLLFGENCSTTYTHLFINYYFFGFLIGLAFFYNNDMMNENSLQNTNIYKPFYYLKDFIRILFKSTNRIHVLIIVITVGIQFLLCFSFLLYSVHNPNWQDLNSLNGFDEFLYLNEKLLFAFGFGFFITHLYTYKFESKLKDLGNNIIMISTNRIGYEFYALIEIMVIAMYSDFGLNYQINTINVTNFSFGIIFFVYFNSLLLFVSFQLPVKFLMKKLLKLENPT